MQSRSFFCGGDPLKKVIKTLRALLQLGVDIATTNTRIGKNISDVSNGNKVSSRVYTLFLSNSFYDDKYVTGSLCAISAGALEY